MEKIEPNDELICPNCLNAQNSTTTPEDKLISCSFCREGFMYLKCYHCKKKIYFNNQNYSDGVNVKCPYEECNKWFSKSSCGACNRVLFFPDRYQEGSNVKCPFKDCGQEYSKVVCPIEKCSFKTTFLIPKEDFSNSYNKLSSNPNRYKEGSIVTCKSNSCLAKFQKMNCYHCLRRLVWLYPDMLIEGQKVVCPYPDCSKSFNKYFCPHCNKCNIFTRGGMEVGTKIKCIYKDCKKEFNKIFCPMCRRTNVFNNGNFLEGVKTTCVYNDCQKKFSLVNCSHCKRINLWLQADYSIGQNIICAYSDCKRKSAKVNCPYCNKINVFPNGDYCFGKTYKCIYNDCQKEFSNFICPGCSTCLNLKGKYLEGNKVICGLRDCKVSFINFRCPHCMQTILDKGATYRFGQTVICPYNECKKKFNYLYCVDCRRGIYYKDNNYQEGQIVKCPYNDCNKNFIFVYCSQCTKPVQFSSNVIRPITPETEIKCAQPACNQKFKIGKINLLIWTIGVPFIPNQGTSMYFQNPEAEPLEIKLLNSIANLDKIYKKMGHQMRQVDNSAQKKEKEEVVPISECTLCMENPKESVFIPCGHRCACYPCAISTFEKYKKCPICQTVATLILKKVFD